MNQVWLQHYPEMTAAEIDIPENQTVASLLEATCHQYEHKEALTCLGTSITFRQLNRRADHFASYLQNEAGVQKGDRVAIMMPNILQFPITLFGAQKIGAVCVNTNPLYTPREMKHQFADSEAKVLVIVDLFDDKREEIIHDTKIEKVIVTSIGDQLPILKGFLIDTVMRLKGQVPKHHLDVVEFKDALAIGAAKSFERPDLTSDDICLLQYTGGTTGVSKGAMLTQENILANIYQIREWAKPYLAYGDETVLTALPLYHIFALSVNFLSFLSMGAQMLLVPKPIPIANTIKMFKKYRISVMTGVNTLYNALNNSSAFRELAPRDLKFALAGGMALQDKVNQEFQGITGVRIIEGFGLTEASPVTHCNPLNSNGPKGSIGVPLPSTDAKIVNSEGQEVPIGEVGELIVRGPQVMKGYWRRPDETAKCLKNGWLWTGDMAREDENGYFYIVDRKKDMIIVSGFNVYPNEVEDVLVSHPKVLEAAVVGIPDEKSGELVKAFIVPRDKSVNEDELRDYCEKNLTGYKRPRSYEFRDELPKSNVGKILRKELRPKAS